MGGVVSSGLDNDELVDNLIESGYIRSKKVEQVFRAVDRADYIPSSHRESAYKDLAWKHGNIHLSAPCVYSNVMEGLSLEPGLSFLNLGSGTGYLSTMAGLILNQHGTNHGIELHEDCLRYAYERLEEFKQKSLALDVFDFCEPIFVQGNCLNIVPGRQYDRVYCGAACPESHEAFIKQFVRVGGILVMPFKEHLLRIQRIDENNWSQYTMLPVSFATLVVPLSEEQNLFHLPECDPLSLQELCRGRIRNRLRSNIWVKHSELMVEKLLRSLGTDQKPIPAHRTLRRFVIPIFEESDESLSEDDDAYMGRARLRLDVNTQSGEAVTTTLQLVRAVVQPQQQQQLQDNQQDPQRETSNNSRIDRLDVTSNKLDTEQTEAESEENPTAPPTCKNEQNNDSVTDQNAESSSDSACERSDAGDKSKVDKNGQKSPKEQYADMSDSDSEAEAEIALQQRKKVAKREKSDSGIVDDVNVANDDASSSSNTNHSDSEIADPADNIDVMDIDLYDISINKSFNVYNPRASCMNDVPNNGEFFAHYIDSNTFTSYMKEKIQQLPLPLSLKLYINYNRKL